MGTNYYAKYNHCHCCDRNETIHVGKSYRTLEAHPSKGINSWTEWKQWIIDNDATIVDEYGRTIDRTEFISQWIPIPDMAEKVATDNKEWHQRFGTDLGEYLDPEGYRFSIREFS